RYQKVLNLLKKTLDYMERSFSHKTGNDLIKKREKARERPTRLGNIKNIVGHQTSRLVATHGRRPTNLIN
ncbi:MAG: hypothetical protein ACLTH4_00705, partial [Lachnospira eligens]